MIDQQTAPKAQAERFSLRVTHIIMRANLSVALKHLLNLLCYHHNDARGYAWPSVERLALMSGGVEPRTIQRQLRKLQERGLIDIQPMPGLRTNAYYLQEQAIAAIAISTITWPKNMLGHPKFACATPDASVAPPRHQSASTLTLDATYPDTGVTLTEEGNGKITEEEERTCATLPTPVPAPAPATPTTPAPPPSPSLFASPEIQNSQTADAPATPAECSVFANLVDRINAQRAVNGKKSFVLADLHTLRAEAAKAHITPIQAAQWVLERPSRNFFRADYFVPTACAPEAPTAPVKPQPVPTPPPAPLTPEAQAAQAEMVAQARAKAIAIVEAMRANKPATGIVPTSDIDVANLRGPQFAVDIVQSYMRGEHVNLRPLELACEALRINIKALRAQRRPVATAAT